MRTRILSVILAGCIPCLYAQVVDATYTTEGQYNLKRNMNWCNLLRLEASLPIWKNGEWNMATIHFYKLHSTRIIDDWQMFSNIEEENLPAALATFGYSQRVGKSALFFGVRNLNEDYFTSPVTSLFTNSSCGIFPTISANYPVANYPLSAMCVDYKVQLGRWGIESSLYNGAAYNGWERGNHPFVVSPRRDGIVSITETNYQTEHGKYFLGAALHNRMHLSHEERDEKTKEEDPTTYKKKVNGVLFGYLEQCVWRGFDKEVNLLAQYSQRIFSAEGCQKYMELGVTFSNAPKSDKCLDIGISTQYAQYSYGKEIAIEVTFRKQLGSRFAVQPALHFIRNKSGYANALLVRCNY